jgi:hypothetical protein
LAIASTELLRRAYVYVFFIYKCVSTGHDNNHVKRKSGSLSLNISCAVSWAKTACYKKSMNERGLLKDAEQDKKIILQRVVTEEEFEKLVTEGWQYLGTLPNGKIVIKNEQGSV